MMLNAICVWVFVHLLVGLTYGAGHQLPYNPSYIWTSGSRNDSVAYILSPKPANPDQLRLRALSLKASFATSSSPHFVELTDNPTFLSEPNSILPLSDDGTPMVYAGDCKSSRADIWHFNAGEEVLDGKGSWVKSQLKKPDHDNFRGPGYLAGAIAYHRTLNSTPNVYAFGGMCPDSGSTQSWVSGANYSRSTISLSAETSSDGDVYDPSVLSIRSPPVAEAGFSMTPLLPAYSNSTSGKQLRQQSFALVGGHTQQAFINMSQIALFSLPETSWSYISVGQGSSSQFSKLAREGIHGIEPRSGHTAVLTSDGTKLIIFGGWVGDISVPAEPQLAVLHLGEDYGGTGNWRWTIPKQSPHGLPEHTGVFGHGAALLPGDIMLVAGGYKISDTPKRSTPDPSPASEMYLFNMTSEAWVTNYVPPEDEDSKSKSSSGPLSSPAQKAGLGVGLGVGACIACAAVFLLLCARTRKSRAHRRTREQHLRRLALGVERPHLSVDEATGGRYEPMVQINPEHPRFTGHTNPSITGAPALNLEKRWGDGSEAVAERTGLLVETPSPTKDLRRGVYTRTYQPAGNLDERRRNPLFSNIHRIDERDEDEDGDNLDIAAPNATAKLRDSRVSIASDPFKDPPSPVKASLPSAMEPEAGSLNALESRLERISDPMNNRGTGHRNRGPQKNDRTLSNLSESSGSGSSVSSYRADSLQRGGESQFDSYQSTLLPSITYGPTLESAMQSYSYYGSRSQVANDDSIDPLRISGSMLSQGESSTLLGSNTLRSESPSRGSRSKALGWVGSVRRALTVTKRGEHGGQSSSGLQRSTSSSPTKSFHSARDNVSSSSEPLGGTVAPRRAVSLNSSALKRKQGAKDWGANRNSAEGSTLLRRQSIHYPPSLDDGSGASRSIDTDLLDYDDEEEWDVEAAAEGRVVQVTYTVPKEKLRVVNAGAGDKLDDDDDNDDHDKGKARQSNDDADDERQKRQSIKS